MMVRRLECSDRGAGYFGDIFIFHFIEISEAEYYPLFLWEPLYAFVQFPLHFVSVEIRVLVYSLFESFCCVMHPEQ